MATLMVLAGSPARAQSAAAPEDTAAPVQLVARSADGAGRELPVVAEQLEVTIDHGHAATRHSHVFQNESGDALEGRYTIDLGTVATATGFSYWNGEQKIVGEIFEKEVAARVYEQVTGTGRDPGLLERTGEGAFSFRVAPIAPGEKKRVELSTSTWLRRVGNVLEYRAPLASDAASGRFHIVAQSPIQSVSSPTHALTVNGSGPSAKVVLGAARASSGAAREVILRVELDERPFTLGASLHRDAGHAGYLLLNLPAPGLPRQERTGRDITLVLDRSGSMMGRPLQAALQAAEGLLRRLDERDRVNVLAFDDDFSSLFERPEPVAKRRQAALDFVGAIHDGGGTDLALALRESLQRQVADDRPDVVLFLTDGQSDSAEALAAAANAPPGVRLYTVGLGSGVDRPLLTRLAREHRGRFTYVPGPEQMESRLAELYSSIDRPVLTDLKLDVEGAHVDRVYPRSLPDLFARDELTVLLRVQPQAGSPRDTSARVTLSGKEPGTGSKLHTLEANVSLVPSERRWVGRLWAQRRVDDLLEQRALSGETEELKRETIELALAYDLVTEYTSFLAIPESEVPDEVRGTLQQERERRAAILARRKDAAALSRSVMPPGDPVLSVRAPRNAQAVTAVFPFGLTLDLAFAPSTDRWEGRFLVPTGVTDGAYEVEVFTLTAEGGLETSTVRYTIDSAGPEFEVEARGGAGGVHVVVEASEQLREVRVVALDARDEDLEQVRVDGRRCSDGACPLARQADGRFSGFLELPPGEHELRIVVTDEARNESVRIVAVQVPEVEGC